MSSINSKPSLVSAFESKKPVDIETVRQLLKDGGDINEVDYLDKTPLVIALFKNYNPETINLLIDSGSDIHWESSYGLTILMVASGYQQDVDIVRRLITAGIDINAKTDDGWTALILAVKKNPNPAIIRELIKAGADITARDNEGYTLLHYAVLENDNRDAFMEVLKQIKNKDVIENGRRIPLIDVQGSDSRVTPLMTAAGNCMKQKYALLLKHGANPKFKDKNGKTAKYDLNYMIESDAEKCYGGNRAEDLW